MLGKKSYMCCCCYVQAIRAAADGPAAKVSLVSGFGLSEAQAEGVLAMTLRWVGVLISTVHTIITSHDVRVAVGA